MTGSKVFFAFLVFFLFTSAQARLVEVEGSAAIENGMTGKARSMAIQNAIGQAAMYGEARVKSSTTLSNHTITMDAASVTASGQVSDVQVLDEWQSDGILHVLIRADVKIGDKSPAVGGAYRKKVAFTQFEVVDRSSMQDMPGLEIEFPRLLLNKLQEQRAIVGVDATAYRISAGENRRFRQNDPPDRESVVRLARELGVQFVIAGIIHDLSWIQGKVGQDRNVVMEIQVLDGFAGSVISRYTYSRTLWGGGDLLVQARFGSDEFFRQPVGKLLKEFAEKQINAIVADIGQMPFSARVIRSEGKRVYFDAGATSLVNVGDVFMAYSNGDATAGLAGNGFLGMEEQAAATLVVKKVQPLFAMGELEAGAPDVKPGDIVRITW